MCVYIYIYICQIEKKKDHTEVIKPGSREAKPKQNEISQRPASGVSRRPAKKAGRVPTQNARPEKNGAVSDELGVCSRLSQPSG